MLLPAVVEILFRIVQVGIPSPKLQQKLEVLNKEFSRCDTVIIGLHIRMGSLEMARKAAGMSENQLQRTEEKLKNLRCVHPCPVVPAAV